MGEQKDRSGDYPIERRQGEIERLHLQGEVLAADTDVMLSRIGVGPGWRCLDLGCGPRGITDALAARVGASGHVTGLEFDPEFVAIAREKAPANVDFITGDAYGTGLPGAGFDLVHVRFLACTAGNPERLLAEAIRLVRPGGTVAFQEADGGTLRCFPPHPAFSALRRAWLGSFPDGVPDGDDDPLAHRAYRLMRRAGLEDVAYRPVLVGVRAGDPWGDYLPATVESLRARVIERGLIAAADFEPTLAACRRHLADPETVFTGFSLVQTWGRVPSSA
jgi:ubiquinone/menaquinone biosynthesis C-methylase UbiE